MEDKEKRSCFFEKTFRLADISMNITLGMFFFTLSNIKIDFVDYRFYWRMYTSAKVLPIMR